MTNFLHFGENTDLIWFSSHAEIGIFARYVVSPFHPSFIDASTFYKPFKRSVEFSVHCVV